MRGDLLFCLIHGHLSKADDVSKEDGSRVLNYTRIMHQLEQMSDPMLVGQLVYIAHLLNQGQFFHVTQSGMVIVPLDQ